jgi:hypothetical protein
MATNFNLLPKSIKCCFWLRSISLHFNFLLIECVIGIATCYGLKGLEIESRWGRDFMCSRDWPRGQFSLLRIGIGSFPGVKRPERGANHSPPSNAGLWMDWSYTFASLLRLHRQAICLTEWVRNLNRLYTWRNLFLASAKYPFVDRQYAVLAHRYPEGDRKKAKTTIL